MPKIIKEGVIYSDGGQIVDTALDSTSTNPVENRVITNEINTINQHLTDKASKAFLPIFGTTSGRGAIADALEINSSVADATANQVGYVYGGYTSNLPSDCSHGNREVIYYNETSIMVKISGCDLEGKAAVWANRYNGTTWTGWCRFSSPFKNADTSYRYEGSATYTIPKAGTYFYNYVGYQVQDGRPYVNEAVKGNTVGQDGCLSFGQSNHFSWDAHLLQLNVGDTVKAYNSQGYAIELLKS